MVKQTISARTPRSRVVTRLLDVLQAAREAAKQRIVTLERDEKSGPTSSRASEDSGRAAWRLIPGAARVRGGTSLRVWFQTLRNAVTSARP